MQLGAKEFFSSTEIEALQDKEGMFDTIISTSSGTLPWEHYIRMLTPEGTICFVGLPPDNISFPATLLADYAQRRIQGSYIGSRTEMKELLKLAEEKDIKASVEVFQKDELNDAVSKIRNNQIAFSAVITNL